MDLYPALAVVDGYQRFTITPWSLRAAPEDVALTRKQELLRSVITPVNVKGRSVLDLGANAGFFALWTLREGATFATCVDIDPEYVDLVTRVQDHLQIDNLSVLKANLDSYDTSADIVFALALVHWTYSCTSTYASLDRVLKRLASYTTSMLIVEWVDPQDVAMQEFRHAEWNQHLDKEPYTIDHFESALSKHFASFRRLGSVSDHRSLYVAYTSQPTIDRKSPLPVLEDAGKLISSRCLTTIQGIAYWSSVYEDVDADVITKVATLDLAAREAHFLAGLQSAHFPRVLHSKQEAEYSIIAMERIRGRRLCEAAPEIRGDRALLSSFISHCIDIVDELRAAGIWHRDIHVDNIIVRNHAPVLIDFGWAISHDSPYANPNELYEVVSDNDGINSDIYAMGKIIEFVNDHAFPEIDVLVELMSGEISALRISDTKLLRAAWQLVGSDGERQSQYERSSQGESSTNAPGDLDAELSRKLVVALAARNRRINLLERRLTEMTAALTRRDAALTELDDQRVAALVALHDHEAAIAERNARIIEVQGEHEQWRDWITRLQGEVAERDARMVELQDEHDEWREWIARLQSEIEQRDARIVEIQDEHERWREWITQLQSEIEQRDDRIADIQEEHERWREWITRLQSEIEQRDARIVDIQEEHEQCRERIARLQTEVGRRDDLIAILRQELARRDGLRSHTIGAAGALASNPKETS